MESQKHLFQLPADIHYLNCAYMSPLLRSVEEAGIRGIQRKRDPSLIFPDDFFNQSQKLKEVFGQLVNGSPDQVAIIHSTSYGLQNALNNISPSQGQMAITVTDEFPSDYYAVEKWCAVYHKDLKIIESEGIHRGQSWNEKILNSITNKTAVVILSSIHWMDGTRFDLEAIGKRCKDVDAVFIVDGTQSVGALPMDVKKYNIDALVCAGYKWLLGPYSIGAAFYSERFNNGVPVEESWLNRANAENFSGLTGYTREYKPGASRYSMGEHSNFALLPMFIRSIEQLLSWEMNYIQEYCGQLINSLLEFLKQKDILVEEQKYRTNHLFGFKTLKQIDPGGLLRELQKRKIFVSVRGDAIRVSPHLYNDKRDIEALMDTLEKIL